MLQEDHSDSSVLTELEATQWKTKRSKAVTATVLLGRMGLRLPPDEER